jgi:hypothetical protein
LFPTGRARPPPFHPSPHGDPISLRVHAPTHPSVCYSLDHSPVHESTLKTGGKNTDLKFLFFSIEKKVSKYIFLLIQIVNYLNCKGKRQTLL